MALDVRLGDRYITCEMPELGAQRQTRDRIKRETAPIEDQKHEMDDTSGRQRRMRMRMEASCCRYDMISDRGCC